MVDALFRHAGAIRTASIEEMFDVAMLLDRQPLPAGNRVAILTNAGGPGILAADACEGHRLHVTPLQESTVAELRAYLPAAAGFNNPIDMLATATAEHYARAMRGLLADPNVDAVLAIFIPPLVTVAADVAAAMREVARTAAKPVLATFMGTAGAIPLLAPIPTYRFPEGAIAALARVVAYAAWRQRPRGTAPDFSLAVAKARRIIDELLEQGGGWLRPADAQRVLYVMGIPTLPSHPVASESEAIERAEAIGYPVALKAVGDTILHKSDVGGVKLHLADAASLSRAYRELSDALGPKLAGCLVQRMAASGVEMFVGGLQDPAFGPVVFCGSGGVLVELFHDAACRLAPLSDIDATEMLNEVRGIARLRGFRGASPADEAALHDVVLRVSALLDGCPEIQELDLNPVTVFARGVSALDARMRIAKPPAAAPTRRVRY
jgi:acyl-CoA synthetase (NDP forming)